MKQRLFKILSFILVFAMMLTPVTMAYAGTDESFSELWQAIQDGTPPGSSSWGINPGEEYYNASNGSSYAWNEILGDGTPNNILSAKFDSLTQGEKERIIEYMFKLANEWVYAVETEQDTLGGKGTGDISSDTVQTLYVRVEAEAGLSGTLLATLLADTKPDYSRASQIYQPFSGVVNTVLGVVSILIMVFLVLTMALDVAYLVIPAFQLALGSKSDGDGKDKGLSAIISKEAKAANQATEQGDGQGDRKSAVGLYFKYRWKGLILLGICLLYLVQGKIFSFIGWLIDLFSGFIGA